MFRLILKSSGWCNLECPSQATQKASKRLIELGATKVKEADNLVRFRANKELIQYLSEKVETVAA